jgi:hypothetical protein
MMAQAWIEAESNLAARYRAIRRLSLAIAAPL